MENMEQKPVQPIELPEAEEKMELEQTGHAGTEKKMAVESLESGRERVEKEAEDYAKSIALAARNATEYKEMHDKAYREKLNELERIAQQKGKFAEEIGELPAEALEPIEEERKAA